MDILANLFSNVASAGDLSTTALSTDTGAPARLFSVVLDSAELKLVNSAVVNSVGVDGLVDVKPVDNGLTALVDFKTTSTKLATSGIASTRTIDLELVNAESEPLAIKPIAVSANQKTSDPAIPNEIAPVFERETQAVERVVVQNVPHTLSIFDCQGDIPDCHGYPREASDQVASTDAPANNDEVEGLTVSIAPSADNTDAVAEDVAADDLTANEFAADDVKVDNVAAIDVKVDDVAANDVTTDDFPVEHVTVNVATVDESHVIDQPKLAASPFDLPRMDLPQIELPRTGQPEHDGLRRVDDIPEAEDVVSPEIEDQAAPVEADAVEADAVEPDTVEADAVAIDLQLLEPVADKAADGSTEALSTLEASSNVPQPTFSSRNHANAPKPGGREPNDPAVVSGIQYQRTSNPMGRDQLTGLLIRSSVAPSSSASLNFAETRSVSGADPKPERNEAVQAKHPNTPTIGADEQNRLQIAKTRGPIAATFSDSAAARSVQSPIGAPDLSESMTPVRTVSTETSEFELTIERNPRTQIFRETVPVSDVKPATPLVQKATQPETARQPSTLSSFDGAEIVDGSLSGDNSIRTAVTATASRGNSPEQMIPVPEIRNHTKSNHPIRRFDPPQSQRPAFPFQRAAAPEIVRPGTSTVNPRATRADNAAAINHGRATPHSRSSHNTAPVSIPEIHPKSGRFEHLSPETGTLPESEPATESQSDSWQHENKSFRPDGSDVNISVPVQRDSARTSRYGNGLPTSEDDLHFDDTKPGTTESDQVQAAREKPNSPQSFDSGIKTSTRIVTDKFDVSTLSNTTQSETHTNRLTTDPVPNSTVGDTQRNSASSVESPAPVTRPGIPQQLLATIENFMDGDGLSAVTQNETVELRMKLNPVDLGEVVLLLNQSADSKTASILVGDKIVQHLVESGMEQLETNLRELGFDSVEVDVFSRDTRDQRFEHAQEDRSSMESQEDQPKSSDEKSEEPATNSPAEPAKQQGINIVA